MTAKKASLSLARLTDAGAGQLLRFRRLLRPLSFLRSIPRSNFHRAYGRRLSEDERGITSLIRAGKPSN